MKRHHNGISEEHIVAYLDGELNVNGEMREALADSEIRHATAEYATLKKIVANSARESRFRLSKLADSRALAFLQDALGKGASLMPDAAPVRHARPAITRTKNFWAKRSTIGFALALLLGFVWVISNPSDEQLPQIAEQKLEQQATIPEPLASSSTEATVPDLADAAPVTVAEQAAPVVKKARKQPAVLQSVATAQPVVEQPANIAQQQESAPEDIMISRRYAKLIKGVRVVEVTQQDKM